MRILFSLRIYTSGTITWWRTIYIRDFYEEFAEDIARLVGYILRDRDSLGTSPDQVRQYTRLYDLEMGTVKPAVEIYFKVNMLLEVREKCPQAELVVEIDVRCSFSIGKATKKTSTHIEICFVAQVLYKPYLASTRMIPISRFYCSLSLF